MGRNNRGPKYVPARWPVAKLPVQVAADILRKEGIDKQNEARIRWLSRYGWMLDQYDQVLEETKKLRQERRGVLEIQEPVKDERSCLPYPKTTNRMYGWLVEKPSFLLEKYGSYIVDHPIERVTLLPGDIPTLAAGNGI